MTGLYKLFWYITMFIFVGLVFYAYTDLPENMVVAQNMDGFPDRYLPKGTYFYSAMGTLLVFNIILLGIGSLYSSLPPRAVITPRKQFWLQDQQHLSKLRLIIKRWFYLLAVVVNICLIATHVLIWSLNIGSGGQNSQYFKVLFFVQVGLFIIAVIGLFWRLNTERLNLSDLPD